MDGYNVAVVGATGAVGEAMVQILEERQFPVKELFLLASEANDRGPISVYPCIAVLLTTTAAAVRRSGFA